MKIRLIHSLSIIVLIFTIISVFTCHHKITVLFLVLYVIFEAIAKMVEHYYPHEFKESYCNCKECKYKNESK